jgi:hypothetical protein
MCRLTCNFARVSERIESCHPENDVLLSTTVVNDAKTRNSIGTDNLRTIEEGPEGASGS